MTKEHIPQFKRIYFIGAGFSAGMGYPVAQLSCPILSNIFRDG